MFSYTSIPVQICLYVQQGVWQSRKYSKSCENGKYVFETRKSLEFDKKMRKSLENDKIITLSLEFENIFSTYKNLS